MAFSLNKQSISIEDVLSRVAESQILSFYLGVTHIPCVINSPYREDNKPSLGLHTTNGTKISFTDFATNESGGTFDLLQKMWGLDFQSTLNKVYQDICSFKENIDVKTSDLRVSTTNTIKQNSDLKIKIREWREDDIQYWKSYGITLKWLKYAEVYPISHKVFIKNKKEYAFSADKHAYAFVERKDNKIYIKIYQPENKQGFKWCSNMNRSVWGLWTKIPKTGDNLFITSSVKDALNLMCNLHIPAICLQGEGYLPKPHVMEELKSRYKNIIVFYDNDYTNPDNPGRKDSIALATQFNLKRIDIPECYHSKDPSDLYKNVGKEQYLGILKDLLKDLLI